MTPKHTITLAPVGEKFYTGITLWRGSGREVRVHTPQGDNLVLDPAPSLTLANHSPDGFNWGYGGSGPSQLALAILLDFTGDAQLSLEHYQDFKWQMIAPLGPQWNLTGAQIRVWFFQRGVQSFASST